MIKNMNEWNNSINENKKKQSILDGTEVVFNLNGVSAEDFGYGDDEEDEHDANWWKNKLEELDGKKAIVDCLATYTELGDKNHEYYDITFGDGTVLTAISGYQLTVKPAKHKANESNIMDFNQFVNESIINESSEYEELNSLLIDLSEYPEHVQERIIKELGKISGKWALLSREVLNAGVEIWLNDLNDDDCSDLEDNLKSEDVKLAVEYMKKHKTNRYND